MEEVDAYTYFIASNIYIISHFINICLSIFSQPVLIFIKSSKIINTLGFYFI